MRTRAISSRATAPSLDLLTRRVSPWRKTSFRFVVSEPTRPDDRVRVAAAAHQSFGAAFPVVCLRRAVVEAVVDGYPDRRHQGHVDIGIPQRAQNGADYAVVDALGFAFPAVGAVSEDDRVDVLDGVRHRRRVGGVADEQRGSGGQEPCGPDAVAHQRAGPVPGCEGPPGGVETDAAGGADNEDGASHESPV